MLHQLQMIRCVCTASCDKPSKKAKFEAIYEREKCPCHSFYTHHHIPYGVTSWIVYSFIGSKRLFSTRWLYCCTVFHLTSDWSNKYIMLHRIFLSPKSSLITTKINSDNHNHNMFSMLVFGMINTKIALNCFKYKTCYVHLVSTVILITNIINHFTINWFNIICRYYIIHRIYKIIFNGIFKLMLWLE